MVELDTDNDGAIDISRGGTGGTTAAAARASLGTDNPANITQDATHRFVTDAEKQAWNTPVVAGATFWTAVGGSPARTSNTTFTVTDASNANLYDQLLCRGTVIKWTDTGAVKQAMVVSASYATNTVTVTVIGDTITASATAFKYATEKARSVSFAVAGMLAVATDIAGHYYAPFPLKVFGADAFHGTAGSANATTYTVSKNGSSVFTTAISIASGNTAGYGFTADSGTTAALGDVFTLNCATVSTTAPVDTYINLFVAPLNNIYLT